ncbi:hypothetical protein [Thermosulfidibacter takaii]|uniref:hypothetical protein n=1 Tax=Thermosulfidibacter takaii TaxID=412593 RepID=UPI00130DFC9A|nr:hypothetical protein [Thermosulfidibacter takaii]
MEKPVVFNCPKCGKQNLVAPERLKLAKEKPIKCWVCGTEFAYEQLMELIKSRGDK